MRIRSVLLLLLIAGFAFAQQTAPMGENDQVAQEVQKKIESEKKIDIDRLQVLHDGETIHLEGVARNFGSRFKAGEIAAKQDGIKNVDNQIAVQSNTTVSDSELEVDLVRDIQSEMRSTPFDLVSVKVSHGTVELSGYVRDYALKDRVLDKVIWKQGVREVIDKIKLASVSAADDRTRTVIYRSLAREFPLYFSGAHPSVVIVVDRGRVTLVGYVNSNIDKQRMLSRVRSITGVISVEDQLQMATH